MKKLLTILISSTVMLFAQLPNASFENWTGSEPDGWTTGNDSSSNLFLITSTTPAYNGSLALKGEVKSLSGFNLSPSLLLGTDGEGIPNTTRYTRLTGYYKFNAAGSDNFTAVMVLTKTGDITVGGGTKTLPPATNFTRFDVDVTFADPSTPDTMHVSFVVNVNTGFGTLGTFFVIDDLSLSTSTSAEDEGTNPKNFSLSQNYPNPFNPSTTIKFSLPNAGFTSLKVYDVLGNEVAILLDEEMSAGSYKIDFDGASLTSGIYYYTLRSGSFSETRKLILMK